VQSGTTTLLFYTDMVLCYPIVLEEKKWQLFVVFFGYPACPVKMMKMKVLE